MCTDITDEALSNRLAVQAGGATACMLLSLLYASIDELRVGLVAMFWFERQLFTHMIVGSNNIWASVLARKFKCRLHPVSRNICGHDVVNHEQVAEWCGSSASVASSLDRVFEVFSGCEYSRDMVLLAVDESEPGWSRENRAMYRLA